MSITNLTRKYIPSLTRDSKQNMQALKELPEMKLWDMIQKGDKSVVHIGMNECVAARITPEGINTVYTDALSGSNAVSFVMKGLDKKPIAIHSHYTPLRESQKNQLAALEKQLQTYDYFVDKTQEPKLFFNLRGLITKANPDVVVGVPNCIIDYVRRLADKFFKNGVDEHIFYYQNNGRPAYFSSANILQFDRENLNKLKLTTVGEKEHFFDLKY